MIKEIACSDSSENETCFCMICFLSCFSGFEDVTDGGTERNDGSGAWDILVADLSSHF